MHPVGPRSSGVYWARRIALAVVAVVVAAAVIWMVLGRGKGSAVDPASQNLTTTPATRMTGVLATDTTPLSATAVPTAVPTNVPTTVPTATGRSGGGSAGPTAAATSTPHTTAGTSAAPTTRTGGASPTAPASTTKAAGTATKAPAATTKARPTTTAPPPPSYDSQGRLLCPAAAVALTATTGAPSYRVGSQPILGMTVTNTGAKPCVRDLSGALQVYTVYTSSGTRVWSTADCFPGQGTDVRLLSPGQSVHYNVKWSGTTSSPGCTAARTRVGPGSYTVVAGLGPLHSTPRPFTLTG